MKLFFKNQLLVLILIAVLLLSSGCQFFKPSPLAIHVLDVGQGDSILIITPNNKTILIDAGEGDYGMMVVEYLRDLNIKKIDWLIATHPHSDHIGGLIDVIENYGVGEFFMPPVIHTSKTFENLILALDAKGLKVSKGEGGGVIEISKDLSFKFLGPVKDYGGDLNNWSIVNQIKYKEKSFIFMGDAEYQGEMDLLSTYSLESLRSHFIKIGHHGSSSSSSREFIAAIRPDIAVISAGRNNTYGHPHKDTLNRLLENDINLYRTDYQGTIIFYSDGEKIWSPMAPIK